MQAILEILKYVLPSLVVFLTVHYVLKSMLASEQFKQRLELNVANQKTILPIRLQAYERMVLFLERAKPDSLFVRIQQGQGGTTPQFLHLKALATLRSEYEHNLAQQMYMTDKSWMLIRTAKESLAQMLNQLAQGIKPEQTSVEFTMAVIKAYSELDPAPIQVAIDHLKAEIAEIFEA